jgi:hypothetical protein
MLRKAFPWQHKRTEELFGLVTSIPAAWQCSTNPCWGGVEYLHRDPASRRRQRKESLKSETVKYGRESQGTRTREGLRWLGPAAIVNDRPILSSERAPHIDKPEIVWQ